MVYFFIVRRMKYSFPKEVVKYAGRVRVRVVQVKEDEVVRNEASGVEILLGVPELEKMTRRKLILLARRVIALAKDEASEETSF
jgi:hypothetical protein